MRALIFVVGLLVLAGCAGVSDPADTSTPSVTSEVTNEASSPTGLRGLVTDDSLSPIEGAVVAVVGPMTANGTTGVDGSFEILDLEPGSYEAYASALGYESVGRRVEIAQGEMAELRVTLAPLPVDETYYVTQTKSGIVFCGMNTGSQSARGNVCILVGQAPNNDYDRSVLYWIINLVDLSGFWSETVFKPSTTLTKGMDLFWALLLDNNLNTPTFASGGNSTSPMAVRVEAKAIKETAKANPTVSCEPEKKPEQCRIVSFHYLRGYVVDGVYWGVAYNQRYDVYLTLFYRGETPEEFSILPPGGP